MNELIDINENEIVAKEWKGHRVVTASDIDTVHNRPAETAGRNFRTNRNKFVEGEDYFIISSDEIRRNKILWLNSRTRRDVVVFTESGYLLLVKSFTDDLSWQVQRKLINSYFRLKELTSDPSKVKEMLAEARERNAGVREANMYVKLAEKVTTDTYKQILYSKSAEVLSGEKLLPLPKVKAKTYTATQIGAEVGLTANQIGRMANKHGLKTEEYGEFVWDKSPYSAHQCETFVYYENVIDRIKEIMMIEVA